MTWVEAKPGDTPGEMEPEVYLHESLAEATGARPRQLPAHPCDNCRSVESKVDEVLERLRRLEPLIEYAEQMMRKRTTFMKLFAP